MTFKLNIRFRLPAITTVFLAIFGGAVLASPGHAAVFNDLAAFTNAANADGIATTTDNFSTYPVADIANGQTLGKFTYSFDSNLTQPTIGVDGPNQVLTGAPFDAFVGGDSVQLTFTSGKTLLAFGATFTYAPAFEPLPANLYNLGILDGSPSGCDPHRSPRAENYRSSPLRRTAAHQVQRKNAVHKRQGVDSEPPTM